MKNNSKRLIVDTSKILDVLLDESSWTPLYKSVLINVYNILDPNSGKELNAAMYRCKILLYFECCTHNQLEDMCAVVEFSKRHHYLPSLQLDLMHDLHGIASNDEFFLPKSDGYAKTIKRLDSEQEALLLLTHHYGSESLPVAAAKMVTGKIH